MPPSWHLADLRRALDSHVYEAVALRRQVAECGPTPALCARLSDRRRLADATFEAARRWFAEFASPSDVPSTPDSA